MFCGKLIRGFWSVDAAFALVLSVAMFAMFSALLQSAAFAAMEGAGETSGALLSARFSSYALARIGNGGQPGLQSVLERTGRKFASVAVWGKEGMISFDSAGEGGGETYCTQRLLFMSGKIVRVESCIK